LYRDIKRRGVILPDGSSVNPAVEAHRKNAHEQLYSLSVYAEVNCAQQAESAIDLVSLMARPATEDGETIGLPTSIGKNWHFDGRLIASCQFGGGGVSNRSARGGADGHHSKTFVYRSRRSPQDALRMRLRELAASRVRLRIAG
jgi:hypothetical protein